MFSFAYRENIIKAYEQHMGNYAAVAIKSYDYDAAPIDEEFIERFLLPEYTEDYFAFSQNSAESHTLESIPLSPDYGSQWEIFQFREERPFTLTAYTDIEKSPLFRIGDRRIIEGRFAENVSECNISAELAELNGLSVGDYIDIVFNFFISPTFSFEIVGIYENNTEEIIYEADLVNPRKIHNYKDEDEYHVVYTSTLGFDFLSSNHILTTVQSREELAVFRYLQSPDSVGFDAVVYYVGDSYGVIAYIDALGDLVPEQYLTLDSGDILRSVILIFEETEKAFSWLIRIVAVVSILFFILIIFFILKDRTYDIGVFRTRGMSQAKTAVLVSGEIFVVSVFAFLVAWIVYVSTFLNIVEPLFITEGNAMMMESFASSSLDYRGHNLYWLAFENARLNHELFLPAGLIAFLINFLATVVFSLFVGLVAVLFISRNEPIKTMTEH
jgi:ABC-type antimicrobial peptide transport system permease subunit